MEVSKFYYQIATCDSCLVIHHGLAFSLDTEEALLFSVWLHILMVVTPRSVTPLFWEEPCLSGAHTEECDFPLVVEPCLGGGHIEECDPTFVSGGMS